MAVSLLHATVATGTDAGNGSIHKAEWNQEHAITMATGKLLGRTTAGVGAVEEISAGAGLTLTAGVLDVGSVSLTTGVTGTLPVGNGGTGQTSYTDGQLLIGNSTGNTLTKATLTAGSGISITNGSGAITIASTGSMVYPGAGIAVSTGSAWGTSKTSPTGDIVGTSDTQTLTNKTLTDPAIIGAILEDVYTISDGASVDIDPGNGTIQLWTLGANRTPTATNFAAGESVTLMVDDGTAYTITWTTIGVVWKTDSGAAPTLNTTGYTAIVLWKVASTVYGARVGNA